MRQLFNSLVEKSSKPAKSRLVSRGERQARLSLEALEQRDLLSGSPLTWTAPAGNASNAIILSIVNNKVQISDNNLVVASQAVASTTAVTLTGAANSKNNFSILSTVGGIQTTVNLATSGDVVTVGSAASVPAIQGALVIKGFKAASGVSGEVAALIGPGSGTNNFTSGFNALGQSDVTLKGLGYSIEVVNVGQVSCTSHSASDVASLASESSGTGSTFTSGFNTSGQGDDTLKGPGYSIEAVNFTRVGCTSHSTLDAASLASEAPGTGSIFASGFNTNGQGDDTLKGPGYSVEAVNFTRVGCSSHSTLDAANLASEAPGTGSTFASGFNTSGQGDDTLKGPGYSVEALNFTRVGCTSHSISDFASLASEAGSSSAFSAGFNGNGQGDDTLKGPGYSVEAVNFTQVGCTSHSASDAAYLIGPSNRSSTFTTFPIGASVLAGSGYSITAAGFQNVAGATNFGSVYLDSIIGNPFVTNGLAKSFAVDGSGNLFALCLDGSVSELALSSGSWAPVKPGASQSNAVWSGYVVSPATNVTAVGGTWVQPTVSGPGATSIWVGIDGFGGSTVEQIGVATSVDKSGVTVYTPWIEFYGDTTGYKADGKTPTTPGPLFYETPLSTLGSSLAVHPGDTISAEVSLVPGTTSTFVFQMMDLPKSGGATETFVSPPETMKHVVPQRSTAEWIVENPNFGSQSLASFTPVTFSGSWATIGSRSGSIKSFSSAIALNLASTAGSDVTTNPLVDTGSLGVNEPFSGGSSSTFMVAEPFAATLNRGSSPGAGQVGILPLVFGAVNTPSGATGASNLDAIFSALGVQSQEGLAAAQSALELHLSVLDAVFADLASR